MIEKMENSMENFEFRKIGNEMIDFKIDFVERLFVLKLLFHLLSKRGRVSR